MRSPPKKGAKAKKKTIIRGYFKAIKIKHILYMFNQHNKNHGHFTEYFTEYLQYYLHLLLHVQHTVCTQQGNFCVSDNFWGIREL